MAQDEIAPLVEGAELVALLAETKYGHVSVIEVEGRVCLIATNAASTRSVQVSYEAAEFRWATAVRELGLALVRANAAKG